MKKLLMLLTLLFACWSSAPQAQTTRFHYLTPIDGSGTEADPFHSRCLGMPGSGNIDLRPFLSINRFWCSSDALPSDMTGVVQLGSSLTETLSGVRKTALVALLGKAVAANTVEDALIELLVSKLRAGRDGKLKIYLGGSSPVYQQTAWVPFRDGGIVADLQNYASALLEPALAWAAAFSETFTGSNQAALAGTLTWNEYTGDINWERLNNKASATGATGATAEARAEHDVDTDDHEVQADLNWTRVGSGTFRCAVKAREISTTARTYYHFGVQRETSVDVYRLLKREAGSPTTIADSAGATSSPATVKLRVDGSTITGFVGGSAVVGPVTDGSITGNTRGGLIYVGDASDLCEADNWSITDYTAPVSFGPLRRRAS